MELPGFTPDDLIGRTFLTDSVRDGERLHARITRKILLTLTNLLMLIFSSKLTMESMMKFWHTMKFSTS
jgi:hypothetical protein